MFVDLLCISTKPFRRISSFNNVDNKISTVVSAPTSAGKSVVAGYTLTKGRGLIVVPTDPLAWQWASYVGGAPVAVTLGLQFTELKLVYSEDIDEGF